MLKAKDRFFISSNPYQILDECSSMKGQRYGFGGFYEVDCETICRYTGLTDKNGNKIWEGDIIRGKNKIPYTVEYIENIAGFIAVNSGASSAPCMNYATMKSYDVIGNVFDNSELLEERD